MKTNFSREYLTNLACVCETYLEVITDSNFPIF